MLWHPTQRPLLFDWEIQRPTEIPGCVYWGAAESITGVADGGSISALADLSGWENNLAASGTAQPLYQANIINSLPIMRFDGTDDVLAKTSGMSDLGLDNDLTIVAVATPKRDHTGAYPGGYGPIVRDGADFFPTYFASGNTVLWSHRQNDSSYSGIGGIAILTQGTFYVIRVVKREAAKTVRIYLNGALDKAGTFSKATGTRAQTALRLGNAADGAVATMDLAAIAIWNRALFGAEARRADRYFGRRYGIAVSVSA